MDEQPQAADGGLLFGHAAAGNVVEIQVRVGVGERALVGVLAGNDDSGFLDLDDAGAGAHLELGENFVNFFP